MSDPNWKPRRHKVDGCVYCERAKANRDKYHPYHDASTRCRSGGHDHCTCDTCY